MRIPTLLVITGLLCALALASPVPANAQGCTLLLPSSIENALNTLLLGACGRHDTCWRTRNPCGGPYLGFGWKATCDLQFLIELEGICQVATGIFGFPNPDYSSVEEFMDDCQNGAELAYAAVSTIGIPFWFGTQCDNGCNAVACPNAVPPRQLPSWCCPGSPPSFPPCECSSDWDCDSFPPPEWGTWQCIGCMCILTNSPLVLHLPDYLPIKADGQSWWKEGFCGPEVPTVCLDWRDEGNLTCTGWTAPDTEVAFVVTLNDDDMLLLAAGQSVRAEPWRHFFGNVTKGVGGDFPFAHGFEALAAFCGQNPEDTLSIDLTECGERLYAWADRSADGRLDVDELVPFQELGIASLGNVRSTEKQDKCGNTFPAESHATCVDRPGKCGTWLDVFFESRPLPVP
jgi:hypothetical protein